MEPTRRYRLTFAGRERLLAIDDEAPLVCRSIRETQDALEGDLALHVAATCPDRVFIHAGVVAIDGRALLLPGRTFSGKSTLVAALVAAGATYYSDEYAVLDAAGRVAAYPRRMSLRRNTGAPRRVLPRRVGSARIRVCWVLGSRYESGATFVVTPLTPGRTALLLLDNAVAARLASSRVLAAVRAVAATCQGASVVRGEARRTVEELLHFCAGKASYPPVRFAPEDG
ncbi:MAG: hypothetical protein ABI321_11030 [Polyangia bacterium]